MKYMKIEGNEIQAREIKIPESMAYDIDKIVKKYDGQFESIEDFVRYALIKVLIKFKDDI